ncbi:hypothetical protein BOTBODRAFT_606631 [Botryobasidium botryosum FD-172 SS1]|uniref:Uncharacterized protein n=1 Tax=Botryobasidium botryosum (strain FD-172 SS1) TaxID=930990 RepID=A0A067MZW4_BOTB1|nr:hypothetical protein BOTBODRAFT_606631 [Botryobasidium botryosum FD-172 SS1]
MHTLSLTCVAYHQKLLLIQPLETFTNHHPRYRDRCSSFPTHLALASPPLAPISMRVTPTINPQPSDAQGHSNGDRNSCHSGPLGGGYSKNEVNDRARRR